MAATHEVTNQPPERGEVNLYRTDPALTEAVARYAGGHGDAALAELGATFGSERARWLAERANANPPELRPYDRYGHRLDEVEFHPAWHELMTISVTAGLAGAAWADPVPAPHLRRAAGVYLAYQVEPGHVCPVSMTYAAVPALRVEPDLADRYEPGLTSYQYDVGLRPPTTKAGLIAGMGMTEKQGGSDVRANATRAEPDGDAFRLTGHKWFFSAPMSDLFLVLAREADGLSCFLVPRVLDDGTRNPIAIRRLKDKLGNRSNASAEVEFDGTVGYRVGPAGRGVVTILRMVAMTRLDCVTGAAGLIRAATAEALRHATYRRAFGRTLRDQPLMARVLADLAVESEAATVLFTRLAHAIDAGEDALARLGLAVAKFWVCKRTPHVVAEALECLGGNGYVVESGMPLLYREAPLNSIWEGSGNVIALDALRAVTREPEAVEAYLAELAAAAGADPRLDRAIARVKVDLAAATRATGDPDATAADARRLTANLATALQAALLVRHAPAPVADAYGYRLEHGTGPVFGTLPGLDPDPILKRFSESTG